MKTIHSLFGLAVVMLVSLTVQGQVPQQISYQGRVTADQTNFTGTGHFKFAFVNRAGTATYWSNDGSGVAGGEPASAIALPVDGGVFSLLLGNAQLSNMTVISPLVFTNAEVWLRIWFGPSPTNLVRLAPDQQVASVGYAMMAAQVPDGSIGSAKLAGNAVGSTQLAPGSVTGAALATGAVTDTNVAANARIADTKIAGTGTLVANLNADLLDGAHVAQLGASVQKVVRGVASFSGPTYETTVAFSPTVDPNKSYVILSPALLSAPNQNGTVSPRSGAALINLTTNRITIAVDALSGSVSLYPMRVGFQIVEMK